MNTQKKFQSIVLATDLDGTFLTKDPDARRRNLDAIAYFKANGGHFTFATGRYHTAVLGGSYFCTEELLNLPAVTGNGSCLYDYAAKSVLEKTPIPYELVREIYFKMKEIAPTAGLRAITDEGVVYTELSNPMMEADFAWLAPKRPSFLLSIDEWRSYGLYKLAIRDELDVVNELKPKLIEAFRGRLEVSQSDDTLIDVQALGVTKARGLRRLCELCFDRPVTLCVAGDYYNDLEMMSIADLAFCPENAVDEVKAICRATLCHHDRGVIAEVIETIETMIDQGELQ